MNFGRAICIFNKISPKISKGIGQVANIARNVGQAVQNVRNIDSTVLCVVVVLVQLHFVGIAGDYK